VRNSMIVGFYPVNDTVSQQVQHRMCPGAIYVVIPLDEVTQQIAKPDVFH
jgi:hypothetical protein